MEWSILIRLKHSIFIFMDWNVLIISISIFKISYYKIVQIVSFLLKKKENLSTDPNFFF